jgi:hypothetical protein
VLNEKGQEIFKERKKLQKILQNDGTVHDGFKKW